MIVATWMSTQPIYANLQDGLHQTYRRMRERGIRHMPVLDGQEQLVGIISERDLLRPSFVDEGPNTSGSFVLDNRVKVAQAMTPDPVTLRADDSLEAALDQFLRHKFGALPVVDVEGRLVGILSTIDLLRVFKSQLQG